MPQFLLATSILAPILGAVLAIATDRPPYRRPWRRFVPLVALGVASGAVALLLWAPAGVLQVSGWLALPPAAVPLVLGADGLSLTFALVLLVCLLACELGQLAGRALRTDGDTESPDFAVDPAHLFVATASLAFLLAANLLTLCLVWVGLEIVLWLTRQAPGTARTPTALRSTEVNLVAILATVAAAALSGYDPDLAGWSAGGLPDTARGFLALAAAIRAGAFPFQGTLPTARRSSPVGSVVLPLVVLGIYLLVRTEALGEMPLPPARIWMLLGGLGLLASVLLPWVREDTGMAPSGLSRWTALGSVSLLVLLAGISDPLAAVAGLLLAINLPLSVGLLTLSEGELHLGDPEPDLWARRAPEVMRWLAVGPLLGLPPTLGSAGRWAAYRALVETGAGLGLAVATLVSVPLAAALFDLGRAEARVPLPAEGTRRSQDVSTDGWGSVARRWAWLAGPALLAVPLLILGVYPLADVVRTTPAGVTLQIVVALILPLAAGYVLSRPGRMQKLEAGRLGQGAHWLADRLTLDWAYALLRRAGRPAGAALAILVAPFHGERYVSWTLLLAVVLLLLLLGR